MATSYPSVPGVTFKDIPDFPGYCIGDDTSIWSCLVHPLYRSSRGSIGIPTGPWHPIHQRMGSNGYLRVSLRRDRKSYSVSVHRLMLLAFVGPPPQPDGPDRSEACHYPDPTPTNNCLDNLRWGSRKANKADSIEHGTDARGVRCGTAKLTEDEVREIRRLAGEGASYPELMRRFGVAKSTIYSAVHRINWAHI